MEASKEDEREAPPSFVMPRREGSLAGPLSPFALLAEPFGLTTSQSEVEIRENEEMFATVGRRMEELDTSIASFHDFLRQQEMYSYLHGIVRKFFKLSTEMKSRMQDISTLYSFLNSYHLSASKTTAGYFSVLPQELCLHILSFLDWRDLNNIALLNRQWRDLSRDNMLWKGMCYGNWKRVDQSIYEYDKGDSSPEISDSSCDVPDRRELEQRSKKRLKQSWKDIFMKRLRVEDNWRTGNVVTSKIIAQGESAAFCLQFDDEHLVTATDVIQVMDVNTGECIRTMQGHRDSVMCLDFNKQYIVSGSKDNSIRVWDINNGSCVNVLEGHDNGVRTLRFDGRQIVSGARDSTIKIWDMHTGDLQNTLRGHHYTVYCLELDKRHIISGSVDKTIRLWDRESGQEIRTMKGHTNSIRCLKFDPTTIVSGAWDNRVMVWDLETGKEIHRFEGHADRIMCVQFDERKIVSGSVDKMLKIWDLRAEGACHTLAGHDLTVYHLTFDDYKIVSASKDRTVITWDFTTEVPLEKRKGVEIIHSFDTSTHHISTNGSIVRNWSVAIPNTASLNKGNAASVSPSGGGGGGFEYGHGSGGPSNAAGAPGSMPQAVDYAAFLGRLYPNRPPLLNLGQNNGGNNNRDNDSASQSEERTNSDPAASTNDDSVTQHNNNNEEHDLFSALPNFPSGGTRGPSPSTNAGGFLESIRRRRERKISLPMFGGPNATGGRPSGGGSNTQNERSSGGGGLGTGGGGVLGMRDRFRQFGYPLPTPGSTAFHSSSMLPVPGPPGAPGDLRNTPNFLPSFASSSPFLPPPFPAFGRESLPQSQQRSATSPASSPFPSRPTTTTTRPQTEDVIMEETEGENKKEEQNGEQKKDEETKD